MALPVGRWHGPPAGRRAGPGPGRGPVLDIGCGPGRHVTALIAAGHAALGIDVSPAPCDRPAAGGRAVRVSVSAHVPGAGTGHRALLDGNIGIGGDPVASRPGQALLTPGGTAWSSWTRPG